MKSWEFLQSWEIRNNFLEKIPEKYLVISEISLIKFPQKSVKLVKNSENFSRISKEKFRRNSFAR